MYEASDEGESRTCDDDDEDEEEKASASGALCSISKSDLQNEPVREGDTLITFDTNLKTK